MLREGDTLSRIVKRADEHSSVVGVDDLGLRWVDVDDLTLATRGLRQSTQQGD